MPVKSARRGKQRRSKAAQPKTKEEPRAEEAAEEEPTAAASTSAALTADGMAFQKGTYLLRLSDLELSPVKDCVWRVDNRQLIQRYNPDDAQSVGGCERKYKRTQNYTGWMCGEGWDYVRLEVTGLHQNQGREESVTIKFPTHAALADAKDARSRH